MNLIEKVITDTAADMAINGISYTDAKLIRHSRNAGFTLESAKKITAGVRNLLLNEYGYKYSRNSDLLIPSK
jgi:hypothetical protein